VTIDLPLGDSFLICFFPEHIFENHYMPFATVKILTETVLEFKAAFEKKGF